MGNYGIFLIMGNAGFCPSTVPLQPLFQVGHVGTGTRNQNDVHHVTIQMETELATMLMLLRGSGNEKTLIMPGSKYGHPL